MQVSKSKSARVKQLSPRKLLWHKLPTLSADDLTEPQMLPCMPRLPHIADMQRRLIGRLVRNHSCLQFPQRAIAVHASDCRNSFRPELAHASKMIMRHDHLCGIHTTSDDKESFV